MQKKRNIALVVNKTTLHGQPNDFKYWQSKTVQERAEALEYLRLQTYGKEAIEQGLQRVYRIVRIGKNGMPDEVIRSGKC